MVHNNNTTFPTQTLDFIIALNVSVGITCCLSIVGASSIILSFILFKEIRTTSRWILLNLSVADLINCVANLIGVASSYKFVGLNHTEPGSSVDYLCKFNAFFGLYGSDSSIMWTVVLLAYLYLTLTLYRPSILLNWVITIICMILCWGIPLAVAIWFLVQGYFGFEPGFSPGFCTYVASDTPSQIYRPIVGYGMFLWPSFVLLPILCIVFICHSKCKMKRSLARNQYLDHHINAIRTAENKLVLVPILFIVIRIWGLVSDITDFYLPENVSDHYRQMTISAFFVFMAGVGDSAQGFVNGIIFCLLTPAIKYRFQLRLSKILSKCYCSCCSCCSDKYSLLTTSLSNVSTVMTDSINSYHSSNTTKSRNGENESIRGRSMTDVSADTFHYGSHETV